MDKKSFFLGIVAGIMLTFVGLFIIALVGDKYENADLIRYSDKPISYEDKRETSFKVFQILGDIALASEISEKDLELYDGNTVVIFNDDNFYNDQIVTIKNPCKVGTYSYISNSGRSMTVPD